MAPRPPLPSISPLLLNSSNVWATTKAELSALYNNPNTGAITTRTSLLNGFQHDDAVHQHTFFPDPAASVKNVSSLNTYGYSPHPLSFYLETIDEIVTKSNLTSPKPVIFSITGSPAEVAECVNLIAHYPCARYAMVEINLSCPNIPGRSPPAYSLPEMLEYLHTIPSERTPGRDTRSIPVGLKLPPFTYSRQFELVVMGLKNEIAHPISFITSTNTLGSSLYLDLDSLDPAIASANGSGIGGMAGANLHPLALGNVKRLRSMLDAEGLHDIKIIGIGGVSDHAGYKRMQKVGAWAVGVGTALGVQGVDVFGNIRNSAQSIKSWF